MMKLLNSQEKADHVDRMPEARSASAHKHYLRNYEYIEYENAGVKHVIAWDKPRIQNEIWYDDECKWEAFRNRNMRYQFNDFGIGRWLDDQRSLEVSGFCSGDHLEEPYIRTWPDNRSCTEEAVPVFNERAYDREHLIERGMVPVAMGEDDRNALIEIIDGLKDGFEQRLARYFKRYPDKVVSRGYWANR